MFVPPINIIKAVTKGQAVKDFLQPDNAFWKQDCVTQSLVCFN